MPRVKKPAANGAAGLFRVSQPQSLKRSQPGQESAHFFFFLAGFLAAFFFAITITSFPRSLREKAPAAVHCQIQIFFVNEKIPEKVIGTRSVSEAPDLAHRFRRFPPCGK